MRKIRENRQEILEIPCRLDPGADTGSAPTWMDTFTAPPQGRWGLRGTATGLGRTLI